MADNDSKPEYTVLINGDRELPGFRVGAEYDTFEDFDRTFKHWCAEKNERFSILNSQTVYRVNKRLNPGEQLYDPGLRYKSAHYICVHGGRSRGHANSDKKYWNKRSEKLGCPACFTISVTRDKMDKLIIRRLNLDHNHGSNYEEEYSFDGFFRQEGGDHTYDSELDVATNAEVQEATDKIKEKVESDKDRPNITTISPGHNRNSLQVDQNSLNQKRHHPDLSVVQQHFNKLSKAMPRRSFQIRPRRQNGRYLVAEEEEDSTDEEDHFCRGVAMKLRKLNPEQKSRAKLQIQTLLHNIEFGEPP